jgi:peroxiredoxin
MVKTASTMLPLGTKAPHFSLTDTEGKTVTVSDFEGAPALLVIFMCNHCPFVKHVQVKLAQCVRTWQDQGVAVVGINSNDVENFPEDSPARMREDALKFGYTFPYLYDETQEVAKAYKAACTPDFFLFGKDQQLVYRGQLDDSRPGNDIPVTCKDLDEALSAVLGGRPLPEDQKPSIGCNIKWKEGNEPDYFKGA